MGHISLQHTIFGYINTFSSIISLGNTELVIHNMGGNNNSKPCTSRNQSECKNKCEWIKAASAGVLGASSYCRNKNGRDDSIMLDSFEGVLEEVLDTINQNRWDKDESSN